jgi:hypothetical protein
LQAIQQDPRLSNRYVEDIDFDYFIYRINQIVNNIRKYGEIYLRDVEQDEEDDYDDDNDDYDEETAEIDVNSLSFTDFE